MRKRYQFRPTACDPLEARVVPSHGGFRNPSVVVSGLTPRVRALGRSNPQPILALVNKSFDSFVQDYSQARAAYLSTLDDKTTSPDTATTTKTAFESYTRYRVELLSNQVVSSVLQSSVGTTKKHGSTSALPSLVPRKLNGKVGGTGENRDNYRFGTLGNALISTIPAPMTGSAAASLSSLAQDQAIESARVGIINGLNIVKGGSFGTSSHK